jgi:hypothetical protein
LGEGENEWREFGLGVEGSRGEKKVFPVLLEDFQEG